MAMPTSGSRSPAKSTHVAPGSRVDGGDPCAIAAVRRCAFTRRTTGGTRSGFAAAKHPNRNGYALLCGPRSSNRNLDETFGRQRGVAMVSLDAKAAFVHNAPVLEHWD